MFKFTYHLTPTSKPGVVYLSPTKATYAKAMMPSLVFLAAFAVYGSYLEYKEKQALNNTNDTNDN